MSPPVQGAVIGLLAIVLFMTGMPIAFSLGLTALISIVLFLEPSELAQYGKFLFDSVNHFGLLAIPLFVLMGNLFGGSVASKHLFEAGEAWLSKLRGGLAMSSVLASAIFAALTGSSPATAAAIGRIAVPEMRSRGYPGHIATGAVAAGGTLGILIPPSVTLILYGIVTETSIGQLFAAGIIPGIVVTVLFCVWIYVATRLHEARAEHRAPRSQPALVGAPGGDPVGDVTAAGSPPGQRTAAAREYTWPERFRSLLKVVPFLALVVAVLGVLYAGVATPSEAAGVGVVLVLLLVAVAYRGMGPRRFLDVLLETTNQSTMILTIVAFSAVIATVLAFLGAPQELALLVTELEVNRWVVLLAINLLLLVMGLFLPPVSIIVLVMPVLLPLITTLGFDPIWFGIIMTLNMEMGLITPPVGLNLYVINGIAPDVPLRDVLRGSLPYVGVLAAGIVILSVFPELVTWLPGVLF
jgi:C4-dicarboxylate transporter, DctM subunit